jgi:hypothetical protein
MAEPQAPEKTQAEIPYGLLEYTAVFAKPILDAWESKARIIASVLDALKPWGVGIDGVEVKTPTDKLNEYAVVFRRTNPAIPPQSITLAFGRALFSAENLDWSEAEQYMAGVTAGLTAILRATGATIQSQHVGLGIHLQFKAKPRKDVAAPLLSQKAYTLLDGEVKCPGIILYREKSSIIIDASVPYANGLFVRMFREHPPESTLQQIAEMLHADETKLFEVLELEGVL